MESDVIIFAYEQIIGAFFSFSPVFIFMILAFKIIRNSFSFY